MFTDLLYLLRARGVPVSPTEWVAFLEGLEKGVADGSPRELYHLAKALLVKHEHLDAITRLTHQFGGKILDISTNNCIVEV